MINDFSRSLSCCQMFSFCPQLRFELINRFFCRQRPQPTTTTTTMTITTTRKRDDDYEVCQIDEK
jgi:hypothetical protein